MTGLDLPISIDRVESEGQAVRNLIELGIIELLGKHAGVPYWTCLEVSQTNAKSTQSREVAHAWTPQKSEIRKAQTMLIDLGYLSGPVDGKLDARTRRAISSFQAKEDLLVNGIVDFDLMERLRMRSAAASRAVVVAPVPTPAAPPRPAPQPQPQPQSTPTEQTAPGTFPYCARDGSCDDVYQNLFDYLQEELT